MAENVFFRRGADTVVRAIAADNAGLYDEALRLYAAALGDFVCGLNSARAPASIERAPS